MSLPQRHRASPRTVTWGLPHLPGRGGNCRVKWADPELPSVTEGAWARGTLCVFVGMVPFPALTLVGAAMLISRVISAVRLTLNNAHSLLEIPVLVQAVAAMQHTPLSVE